MVAVRRLKTADNVRQALGWIFRQVEGGKMDTQTARVLVYTCATLGAVIRDSDIEGRIDALEVGITAKGAE